MNTSKANNQTGITEMKTLTVQHNGQSVSKKTAKTDITHVVVSMYEGKLVISGMFKTKEAAEKRVIQPWNPEWTDHAVVEVVNGPIVATVETRRFLGNLVGL
jgi:hypothetical protein